MNKALRKAARHIYNAAYGALQNTQAVNPFIPKKLNGNKIIHGHIRIEQETNPLLDHHIISELTAEGIEKAPYRINIPAFEKYLSSVHYPPDYYRSENGNEEFIEKALEHFLSLQFIELNPGSVLLDVGSGNSPFAQIAREYYGIVNSFRHDIVFPVGIKGMTVGSTASALPFEDGSVDAITLHCSLEHFEGREDIGFFREAERTLKPGGKCVCLPFYLSSQYTVHLDPVLNLLRFHRTDIHHDAEAVFRHCDSRQFFSRHYDVHTFNERILKNLHHVKAEVLHVENFKDVNKDCYVRFILVLTKIK